MKTKELERILYAHLYGNEKYITYEMKVPTAFHKWEHQKHWLQGSNLGEERVDACMYNAANGKWYFYELKVSVNDFHSSAKLSFQGNYNYFVLPQDIYEKVKDEIAENYKGIGVYVAYKNRLIQCVVKPKQQDLQVDEESLKIAFVRSLTCRAFNLQKEEIDMTYKLKWLVEDFEKRFGKCGLVDITLLKSEISKRFKIDM